MVLNISGKISKKKNPYLTVFFKLLVSKHFNLYSLYLFFNMMNKQTFFENIYFILFFFMMIKHFLKHEIGTLFEYDILNVILRLDIK